MQSLKFLFDLYFLWRSLFSVQLLIIEKLSVTPDIRRILREALTNLYETSESARIIALDAGLNPSLIDFSGTAQNFWHDILNEASKQNQVQALLAIAKSDYPDSPQLQQAILAVNKSVGNVRVASGHENATVDEPVSSGVDSGRISPSSSGMHMETSGSHAETVRILFLAANPRDTDRLRLAEEARTIEERIRGTENRERFEFITHWAVRPSDLSDYLLRHRPHIIHFSGHGRQEQGIVLENEQGQAQTVPPQALARLLRILKDNIQIVVLNACLTIAQAEAITEEINCVVGISSAAEDERCIRFASGFYRALGYGRSVQTAFDLGCNEIGLFELAGEGVPELFTKEGVDASVLTL